MIEPLTPLPPVPSKERTADLIAFLAANVDVSKADGRNEKAARYQEMLDTAKTLVGHLDELMIQWGTRRRVGSSVVYSMHATEADARDWVTAEPNRSLAVFLYGEWHLAPEAQDL